MSIETDTTLSYLEREREIWMVARARDERAGGNNGEAKADRERSMVLLNEYLEDLFVAIGGCALAVDNLGISPA